jgi:hypothetical protein
MEEHGEKGIERGVRDTGAEWSEESNHTLVLFLSIQVALFLGVVSRS